VSASTWSDESNLACSPRNATRVPTLIPWRPPISMIPATRYIANGGVVADGRHGVYIINNTRSEVVVAR